MDDLLIPLSEILKFFLYQLVYSLHYFDYQLNLRKVFHSFLPESPLNESFLCEEKILLVVTRDFRDPKQKHLSLS